MLYCTVRYNPRIQYKATARSSSDPIILVSIWTAQYALKYVARAIWRYFSRGNSPPTSKYFRRYSTVPYGTVQYSTVRYSTLPYGAVQYRTL